MQRARNPYINYHMMRFWPSLEMVLLTGFHSNLNLLASFGEDSASTWKLNTLRKLNYSELLCWVLTSAKTATASSPTITWTKYLHGSNQQESAGDFFVLGIRGFHTKKTNTTAAFQAVGLLFLRIFIPSKGQLTIRVLQSKKNKCVQKTTPMVQAEIF